MNNARCTQERKSTHGLDGQHQNVDMTPHGKLSLKWRKYVHCVANPGIKGG